MGRLLMMSVWSMSALLTTAGCSDRPVSPSTTEIAPHGTQLDRIAAETGLDGAAVFECASGETIWVRFDHETDGVTLKRGDGVVLELPLEERQEFEIYADQSVRLAVGPGEALMTAGGSETSCRGASRPLDPPQIAGAKHELRQSDDASTIDLAVGEVFSISLVGVPTAGYQWSVIEQPSILEPAGEAGGATSTAQYLPGFAGGNHWEVFAFRALTAGTNELALEQRRPFEDSDQPAADRFSLTVVVR